MLNLSYLLVGNAMLLLTWYFLLLNQVSKHILMIYFWIHMWTYGAITALFIFEDTLIKFDTNPLKTIIFDFTYTNFPLYFISSACLIGSYILFDYLSQRHDIAKIIALSQISIIISTVGYHFLGDKMSLISSICMGIIVIGALISGLTRLSFRHPIASLRVYDRHLISWSLLNAIFIATPELITFLCSEHYDPTTREILKLLTKHAHGIPFVTVIPLYMNIGVQWFNIMLLYFWIRRYSHERIDLITTLQQHKKLLFTLAVLHTGYIYCYYTAFSMIENKNIISGIMQLYLPLTMVGGVALLHQRYNKFEAVGMGIIAFGCLMSVFTL
ncbi:MAG: hypothetical protein WC747_01480 [Candidatus Babeliales bacterium]|jgi:drug/metabolite transporter (DMT)-like permease